ncbi:MAG: 4Fe-4S dicluster domain-containing protein [bacterium]
MDYLGLIYYICGSFITIFLVGFIITTIIERNRTASFKTMIITQIFLSYWFVTPLFINSNSFKIINLSLMLIFLFLFFLPIGKKHTLKINALYGEAERIDERDTMFARSYLKKDTENYNTYYSMHPERKIIDDKIRAAPELLSVGGKFYDEFRSAYIKTLFDIEESRISEVSGVVNTSKIEISTLDATKLIKELTIHMGADEVGIANLNPNYIYSHSAIGNAPWGSRIENNHTFVIAYTLEMDYLKVRQSPDLGITEESANRYLDAQKISIALAGLIRDLGYSARAHISGSDYQIMLPPVAYDAGLGELGRLNFLISKKYGARIRLGAVTTNLNLIPDKPIQFGIQDFCNRCLKCVENCPSGAISKSDKKDIRGVEKWDFNIEQCYKLWRHYGTDCGICMKVCPFSHPDNFVHNIIRYGIKNSVFARQISVWGDNLIYTFP